MLLVATSTRDPPARQVLHAPETLPHVPSLHVVVPYPHFPESLIGFDWLSPLTAVEVVIVQLAKDSVCAEQFAAAAQVPLGVPHTPSVQSAVAEPVFAVAVFVLVRLVPCREELKVAEQPDTVPFHVSA